jgi:hypothetical protein
VAALVAGVRFAAAGQAGLRSLLLIAALLVLALAVAVVAGMARNRAEKGRWNTQLRQALAKVHGIESNVPALVRSTSRVQRSSLWSGERPRLLSAEEQLTELVENAPDDTHEEPVSRLRAAVVELMAALDQASGLVPTPAQHDGVDGRPRLDHALADLSAALSAADRTADL